MANYLIARLVSAGLENELYLTLENMQYLLFLKRLCSLSVERKCSVDRRGIV